MGNRLSLGAQGTIAGGGRYDGLVKAIRRCSNASMWFRNWFRTRYFVLMQAYQITATAHTSDLSI